MAQRAKKTNAASETSRLNLLAGDNEFGHSADYHARRAELTWSYVKFGA